MYIPLRVDTTLVVAASLSGGKNNSAGLYLETPRTVSDRPASIKLNVHLRQKERSVQRGQGWYEPSAQSTLLLVETPCLPVNKLFVNRYTYNTGYTYMYSVQLT